MTRQHDFLMNRLVIPAFLWFPKVILGTMKIELTSFLNVGQELAYSQIVHLETMWVGNIEENIYRNVAVLCDKNSVYGGRK